jgi:hypothetical protein
MASRKDSRLNGVNPLSYVGVNAASPSNTAVYNRAPTSDDRRNFDIGARWIDESTTPPDLWTLVKFAGSTATWINLSSFNTNGTDGQVLIGGGTAATWNNITSISGLVVINEGPNTLDLDLSGTVADIFQADTLFATPSGGVLTLAGGTSITTTGSGSTVTFDVDTDVATTFAGDSGTATPAANVLTIAGGTNVTTNASGSTVTITATGGGGGGAANASFLAHQATSGGDPNGGVKLGAAVVMTEVYDVGSDFTVGDGAGVSAKFTAPQDGKYLLTCTISLENVAVVPNAVLDRYIEMQTSNRTYREGVSNTLAGTTTSQLEVGGMSFSVVADMDASDTAEFLIWDAKAAGSYQVEGDIAGTGEYTTFVSGALQETDNMSFTEHAVLVGNSTGGIGELALATDGQVLIGATGAASAWSTLTAGSNITITNGANSIQIASTGGGLGSSVASFLAHQVADGGDPASAGGGVKLGAAVIMTEIYDTGADFSVGDGAGTAATFTAPQDGKYLLTMSGSIKTSIGISSVLEHCEMQTSNRTYRSRRQSQISPGSITLFDGPLPFSVAADMDLGDTVEYYIQNNAIIGNTTIEGDTAGTGEYNTYVSGTLV